MIDLDLLTRLKELCILVSTAYFLVEILFHIFINA